MKVLLTGGTGYVGTALRRALREQGHDVRLLVRRSSEHKVAASEGFEVVYGDALDKQACLRAADGCEAAINVIGIIREFPQNGTTYEALHTSVTYNVVDASRRMGVERFIQMSALGAREGAPARYHRTKFEAEKIVRDSGLRWTIFRPSIIFHPGDEFTATLIDLVHRPLVPIIDGGKALLQPVSLENVVSAMSASLRMPETQGEIYEVGGPDRIAFIDLISKVASHCEVWMNSFKVSSRLMRPMVGMLQRFRSFPLTNDQLTMLVEDNICDSTKFVDTFGVELDSYLEALPALLEGADKRVAAA